MTTGAQPTRGQIIHRGEVPQHRDAVEPASPGHSHRPLEGVTRQRRGAGVGQCL